MMIYAAHYYGIATGPWETTVVCASRCDGDVVQAGLGSAATYLPKQGRVDFRREHIAPRADLLGHRDTPSALSGTNVGYNGTGSYLQYISKAIGVGRLATGKKCDHARRDRQNPDRTLERFFQRGPVQARGRIPQ